MLPDWELWIDSNISPIIAKWISEEIGLNAKSSYTLKFNAFTDKEIYGEAKLHGKVILISKDAGFADLISRSGAPPKLINIRIGNTDNNMLWNLLKLKIEEIAVLLTTTDIDIVDFER